MLTKLRAWDKKDNVMRDVSAIRMSDDTLKPSTVFLKVIGNNGTTKEIARNISDVDIMECLDIKDRDGNFIYDGDILEGYISYPGDAFSDEWQGHIKGQVIEDYKGRWVVDTFEIYEIHDQLRIVGNEYEG